MRCSRKCAMGIDIHDREEVRIGECISCMRCVGSCAPEALRADPGPAVAGTASALVLCGMISLGSSATVGAAASEQGSAVYYDAEVTTEAASETAEETEKASTDTKVSSSEEIVITEDELSQNDGFSDGVYTGTGSGLRGQTKVTVTVESGRITDITVVSYSDDREYFSKAQNSVIQAIISSQSTDVKTVSGATFSSNSIIEAVSDALGMEFSNPNSISGHGKVKR